jgi:O-antigen/teichoic acid export membrane protein
MMDANSVGIYSSAVNIAEIWNFIPVIIVTVLFPAIIYAKKTSEELYYSRLKNISLLFFILSVSVAVITTIFAPLIIKIIYGNAFIGAITILKIYVWSNIGMFFGILATNYLVAENRRKTLALITFIPMIINVILNLMFIPKYGITGSAYATLISYSMVPISLMLFKEPRKIFLK